MTANRLAGESECPPSSLDLRTSIEWEGGKSVILGDGDGVIKKGIKNQEGRTPISSILSATSFRPSLSRVSLVGLPLTQPLAW